MENLFILTATPMYRTFTLPIHQEQYSKVIFELDRHTDCSTSIIDPLVQHYAQLTTYKAPFILEALLALSDSTLPLEV